MTWLSNNWIWIAFGVGMLTMHLFGHSHRHSHGRHSHQSGRPDPDPVRQPDAKARAERPSSGVRLVATGSGNGRDASLTAKDISGITSIVRPTSLDDAASSNPTDHATMALLPPQVAGAIGTAADRPQFQTIAT